MKILITSGGTRVPIDSVRFIGNMSSGRYGAEIAEEFFNKLHEVHFIHAKHSVMPQYRSWSDTAAHYEYEYSTYDDYSKIVLDIAEKVQPYMIISAAAVSDYSVANQAVGKITSDDEYIINLKKVPKILPEFKKVSPNSTVVGFKLLVSPTEEEVVNAISKVLNNGADYVVYNDLTEIRKGNYARHIYKHNRQYKSVNTAEQLVSHLMFHP